MHGHAETGKLVLVPAVQRGDAVLERVAAGLDEVAAQRAARLVELHVVAAQEAGARRLHAGHAAAYHEHLFLIRGGGQSLLVVTHCRGVHGAERAVAGEHGVNAVGAGYAGADQTLTTHKHLLGVVGVNQEARARTTPSMLPSAMARSHISGLSILPAT